MSFKKVLGHVVPIVASVATSGVLGPGVAGQVSKILKLGKNPTDADVEKALATANPEQYVALRQLEEETKRQAVEAKLHLAELEVEEEKVHQRDRDSARKREMEVKDKTPSILAYVMCGGALGLTAWVTIKGAPEDQAASLLIGSLIGYSWSSVQTVISYYFGSSTGSKAKTEAMGEALKK